MLAFLVFLFALLFAPCKGLPDQSFNISSTLSHLPDCAVKCLIEAVAASPCSSTNTTCICTTSSLQDEAETCIRSSCTVKQALFTQNTTMTACGAPVRNREREYIATALAFCVPANLLILLRILFKLYEANSFQADDYMISATLVSGVLGAVVNICGVAANGLGRDIWTIEFGQITNFAKFFYIMTILYTLTLNLLKLSMLVFFLRLFPSSVCPRAYKVTMATTVFIALFTFAFLMIGLFPCSPVNFFWWGWDGEHSGSCVNMQAVAWSFAIIGILLDIWMLAIPLSQVRSLKLSPLKMLGVGLMFLVGIVMTIVSIIRLQFLQRFHLDSQNPTWDYYEISKWSTIEITVGMICVCLPSLRLMLTRLYQINGWISVKEGT
ncbi:hypothetical protein KAF25_002168, partial [Fusarium avenaceum]